ncbi:hypothetical protein AST99_14180 [Formosa algae]|nr:hypothetical protein AST99_14180 [Formosa algae]
MIPFLIIGLFVLFKVCLKVADAEIASGTLDQIFQFSSKYITPRTVGVWSLEDYSVTNFINTRLKAQSISKRHGKPDYIFQLLF